MKTVKQILEQYNTLETKQSLYDKSLVDLSSIGLLDEHKIPLIDKAIKIDAALLSEAEKRALIELLQNTAKYFLYEAVDPKSPKKDAKKLDVSSKDDKDFNPPMVLYFQRQSIRMFPNEVMVAMYYSKQLNKYISVPFGKNSIEYIPTKLDEMNHALMKIRKSPIGRSQNNTNTTNTDERPLPYPHDKIHNELSALNPDVAKNYGSNIRQKIADTRKKRALNQLGHSDLAKLGKTGIKHAFTRAFDPEIHGPPSQRPVGLIGAAARGTLAAGSVAVRALANKVKERRAAKAQVPDQQGIDESLSFPKSFPKRKPFKPKIKDADIWGKRTKEPSEPKEKSEPRKVAPARTSKPAPSKPSTKSMWDNFDLEKQYKKVKTAARDASEHDTTETWVDGKKVSVTKKKFYGDAAKEIASRLASSGKAVPHVGASKSLRKPSPNSVKPPVQAESFRRNLEKIREDHMEEGIIKDVIGGVKKLFKPKDPRDKNKTGGNSQVNSRDKYTDRSAKTSLAPIERARSGTMSTSAAQLTQRQGGVYTNMVESLKEMVDGQVPNIALNVGDSSITINNRIARKVINVYESLNKTNKKKLEKMLNEDANSFRKAINFIIKA